MVDAEPTFLFKKYDSGSCSEPIMAPHVSGFQNLSANCGTSGKPEGTARSRTATPASKAPAMPKPSQGREEADRESAMDAWRNKQVQTPRQTQQHG